MIKSAQGQNHFEIWEQLIRPLMQQWSPVVALSKPEGVLDLRLKHLRGVTLGVAEGARFGRDRPAIGMEAKAMGGLKEVLDGRFGVPPFRRKFAGERFGQREEHRSFLNELGEIGFDIFDGFEGGSGHGGLGVEPDAGIGSGADLIDVEKRFVFEGVGGEVGIQLQI